MKDSLQPGLKFEFQFQVPENKTVPHLYPESPEFQLMPRVLATGYMVGLFEWACIQALNPHLDWPREQTVGIHVDLDHTAATPPGLVVTVKGTLTQVEGRKLTFAFRPTTGWTGSPRAITSASSSTPPNSTPRLQAKALTAGAGEE